MRTIFLVIGVLLLCLGLISGCTITKNYGLPDELLTISEQQKKDLLAFVYNESNFPAELTENTNAVIMVLWNKGKREGAVYIEGSSLEKNIQNAVEQLKTSIRGKNTGEATIELHLHILDAWKPQDSGFEIGADAVKMKTSQKDGVYRGSFAIEENKSEQDIRTLLCSNLNLQKGCINKPEVEYMYAPELHIARKGSGEVITFYRGKQVDETPSLEIDKIRNSRLAGEKRLLDNLDVEGKFTYVYNPTPATYSTNNNLIRQFMASRYLATMAVQDTNLLPHHQRNLDYIFSTRYQEEGDKGRVVYAGTSKLGAIAMLLRTLAVSPLLDEYADQAEKLANTILALQNPDGSFEPWWIEPDYEYDKDYLLTFYSGEGIVALIEYYLRTQQQRRLDAAIKAQNFYLERYITQLDENYYPAYVPRHTISLYHLYLLTEDERYAKAIFTLNDKVIDEMLHITSFAGQQDLVGRFYNPAFPQYGTPHSASDGVYVEGIAYAYEIAKLVGDSDHQEKYLRALELGVHNLMNLQYDETDAYFVEHHERVIGALRFNVTDNRIRTDTTQHALDALLKVEELLAN